MISLFATVLQPLEDPEDVLDFPLIKAIPRSLGGLWRDWNFNAFPIRLWNNCCIRMDSALTAGRMD
jgi:hypothetical protein